MIRSAKNDLVCAKRPTHSLLNTKREKNPPRANPTPVVVKEMKRVGLIVHTEKGQNTSAPVLRMTSATQRSHFCPGSSSLGVAGLLAMLRLRGGVGPRPLYAFAEKID